MVVNSVTAQWPLVVSHASGFIGFRLQPEPDSKPDSQPTKKKISISSNQSTNLCNGFSTGAEKEGYRMLQYLYSVNSLPAIYLF